MKDAIGQELNIGDIFVHCGGKYASVALYEIVNITPKMVQYKAERWQSVERISIHPSTVIKILPEQLTHSTIKVK
jgi:hypothetical protein